MCKSYCVTCKKNTDSINPKKVKAKNGRLMEKSNCVICGKNKSKFIKGVKDNVDYFRKGRGVDIHKAILKVAPKKGFVMYGHKYTGPGNPLNKQLKWDPNTGKILEIYEKPTGKTDGVSMQHDVDYSVCANKPSKDQVKCKNKADRKMVKSLDAIPWKDRQWGHVIARNAIASKAKLGLGVKKKKKPKNVKNHRVKKTGKKN